MVNKFSYYVTIFIFPVIIMLRRYIKVKGVLFFEIIVKINIEIEKKSTVTHEYNKLFFLFISFKKKGECY